MARLIAFIALAKYIPASGINALGAYQVSTFMTNLSEIARWIDTEITSAIIAGTNTSRRERTNRVDIQVAAIIITDITASDIQIDGLPNRNTST